MRRFYSISVLIAVAGGCVVGCVYRKESGRFESVPPMGSNTVDGVRETIAWFNDRAVPVEVDPPPLPDIVEVAPERPEDWDDAIYSKAHWAWHGGKWVWVKGQWLRRPYPNAIWVPAQFFIKDGRRFWRPGHWE